MATKGRKPGRGKVDPNETKAGKFVRLAQKRVSKALNAIRQIGQLSGGGYESTDAQVEKMFAALSDAAQDAYKKFKNKGSKAEKESFTL